MLSRQEEEQERIETLRNDLAVQRQQKQQSEASTYLEQYHSDVGGRFNVTEHETVIGRVSPKPPPLPAASPWSGSQPEPPIEPPTGYEINRLTPHELAPSMAASVLPVEQTGGAEAPSSPPGVEHAAPPSSCDDGGFDDAA
jgi:hypothetical protein